MSASHDQGSSRDDSGVRAMIPAGQTVNTDPGNDHGTSGEPTDRSQEDINREIDILNHCIEDLQKFMLRLHQASEAQTVLNQRKKRGDRKSKKNTNQCGRSHFQPARSQERLPPGEGEGGGRVEDCIQDSIRTFRIPAGDLLTTKATLPPEEQFVGIFQKVKYSICLLDRLKFSLKQPDAPELLHHIFVPLKQMAKTNGGPTLGASVVSPAMTRGAVSLLQEHLNEEEKELWRSFGTNWTSCKSAPPYSPVFLNGWKPPACDLSGQVLEDPVQSQLREDAVRESRQTPSLQEQTQAENQGNDTDNVLPRKEGTFCSCRYAFVARNNSELSVRQGETLEVLESSKRWWKCRSQKAQVGYVPYNILEPLPAGNVPRGDNQALPAESKDIAPTSRAKSHSNTELSTDRADPAATKPQPQITLEEGGQDQNMNNELLQWLTKDKSSADWEVVATSSTLTYKSSPAEVTAWLRSKNLIEGPVSCLGILNGAQLFSLLEEELCVVLGPEEGVYVYSLVQDQLTSPENSEFWDADADGAAGLVSPE
ncbi:epidermal growth factor receptor kinase substrate 8-like protein 1a isoform X2 [Nothobranchius furzeri]|uniref:epidermal growth factor receptor kinase substrate 8-like protein 1a isoform X2 n=1 Tax=Nothobranchius furzeri TaxID=105023 RepID=UPI0039047FC6